MARWLSFSGAPDGQRHNRDEVSIFPFDFDPATSTLDPSIAQWEGALELAAQLPSILRRVLLLALIGELVVRFGMAYFPQTPEETAATDALVRDGLFLQERSPTTGAVLSSITPRGRAVGCVLLTDYLSRVFGVSLDPDGNPDAATDESGIGGGNYGLN